MSLLARYFSAARFGILLFKQRRNHQVFMTKPINRRLAISISCLSVLLFSVNLFLSETDRPQLLQRILIVIIL